MLLAVEEAGKVTKDDIKEAYREAVDEIAITAERFGVLAPIINPDNMILTLANIFIQLKQLDENDRRVVPVGGAAVAGGNVTQFPGGGA